MGWDVRLEDRSLPPCDNDAERYPAVQVRNHTHGGQYAVGGTTDASLYVTYNYSKCLRLAWRDDPSLGESNVLGRMIDGKTARDVTLLLSDLMSRLGTDRYEADYWADTPGNTGYALSILFDWAKEYPDAVFRVE